MKTGIFITIITLMVGISELHAQTDMFDKLSNDKNITTVYISKALLGMIPNKDFGAGNISGLMNKLEQIEIYTGENKKSANLMKSEMKSLTRNKAYEVLMTVKDHGENVTFYAQKEKDSFKDLIMFIEESEECTIIRLIGTFTAEDVQKYTNR